MKFRLNSFNGCQVTEQTQHRIANDQREITLKIYKAELWFLCMTHRPIVLYNCMKFHLISFNGCQLTEQTRNSIANDQREITPKISKAELWFLCITHNNNNNNNNSLFLMDDILSKCNYLSNIWSSATKKNILYRQLCTVYTCML